MYWIQSICSYLLQSKFKAEVELCSNKRLNKAEVVLVITLMSDQEKLHSKVAQMG